MISYVIISIPLRKNVLQTFIFIIKFGNDLKINATLAYEF